MPPHTLMEIGADDGKEAITVELTKKEIKQFKIGEKITITLKGSVGLLEIPPGGATDNMPPTLGIRIDSKKVEGSNMFAELSADEDED